MFKIKVKNKAQFLLLSRIWGTKQSGTPLHEHGNVPKLLNRSKLVKGWLLCNKGKKLKFNIKLKFISTNLQIDPQNYM